MKGQLPLWTTSLRRTDKNMRRPWQIWERRYDGRERQIAVFRTQPQAQRAFALRP